VSYGVLSFWSGWRPGGNATGVVVVSLNAEIDQAKERVMKVPEQVYDGYPAINRQSRKSQEKTLRTRGYWHRCGD
jgi:hypothetical protein